MSTTILTLRFKPNGVLTNATSVVLSDATAAYGVRRTDTLALVVAAGTPMVNGSAGIYTYTLTDPAYGLTYDWVARVVYLGETYHLPAVAAGGTTEMDGQGLPRYCSISDLLNAIEQTKVEELSIDDPTTETISSPAVIARLNSRIAAAEARLDGVLGLRYTVPVTGTIPQRVKDLAVEGTFVELAKRRISTISDGDKARWGEYDKALEAIADGKVSIPGLTENKALPWSTRSLSTAPAAKFATDFDTGESPLSEY